MKVLAAKVADLGDVLLTTPAIAALHQADCEVDVLIAPHCSGVVAGAPFLRTVVTTDRDVHLNPLAWRVQERRARDLEELRRLRRAGYEALCLFHHLTTWRGVARWALVSAILGVPVRAGLDNGRGHFLTQGVTDAGFGVMHEADYWLEVAAAIDAPRTRGAASRHRAPLWLPATTADRAWATAWHTRELRGRPYIAVHPGVGGYIRAKKWPVSQYAALVRRIVGAGYAVAVVGGRHERPLARACVGGVVDECVDLTGRTTIGQTAAVVERSEGFAGNDSFPMHLAAAAQRPTVGIFGPSNAAAWGPWPAGTPWLRVAQHATWCQPCMYSGHTLGRKDGCGPRPCLTKLHPDSVFRTLQEAMEARRQPRYAMVASP